MALERWGTLSVRDHLDLSSLIANVILYDRLVIPVPFGEKGRAKWWAEQWGPDVLDRRLEQLGDRAVRKPWDEGREARYHNVMQALRDVEQDAGSIVDENQKQLPYQVSRHILAQEKQSLPRGVTRVEVVAAFNSLEDLNTAFRAGTPEDDASLAVLLRHRLAVPAADDQESALNDAIALSSDTDFQDKRRDFYEWQDKLRNEGASPRVIAEELEELVQAYNRCVERAVKKVQHKFAFMVGGIAISLAGAIASLNPLPAAGALLTLISFKLLDGKPALDPGRNRPAAMFHDFQERFR